MLRLILFTLFYLCSAVLASDYKVYGPENYSVNSADGERILFIMDFSNSMTEYLEGREKVDLMIETMAKILPSISPDTQVGLRVYGHKNGFTAMDACRASSLLVPVSASSAGAISASLYKTQPKGMTPITYSLKQAVKNDFTGFAGKKRIILLTDGGENCDESPCSYVLELIKTRKDIAIDVIAFNISDEDDLDQLECTSLVTSGKFYNARTAAQLVNSLNNSVNSVKKVEAKIIEN